MKKLLITLTDALTISAAFPAIAGPDWQLIEQARKAKAAKMQRETTPSPQPTVADNGTPKRVVLPLDHGPRAQTTPWLNRQRLLRAEQEARKGKSQE
ncbi:MAG TPA: hypothetical protein DHV59_05280 [Oxalobacteraceae bacterium]|nr:hypothetical protein [Oxalobacteraceae bacterium]